LGSSLNFVEKDAFKWHPAIGFGWVEPGQLVHQSLGEGGTSSRINQGNGPDGVVGAPSGVNHIQLYSMYSCDETERGL